MEAALTKRDLRKLMIWEEGPDWIKANSTWILPQWMSILQELPLVIEEEKVSAQKTLEKWKGVMGTLLDLRAWKVLWGLLQVPRSQVLVGSQNQHPRWSEAVPLVLSAFKEHRGVSYQSWDWNDPMMEVLVGNKIWSSYLDDIHPWDQSELMAFRELGLRVRTGKNAGGIRSLTSYLPWGGVTNQTFKDLSVLTKYMITQTWVYHPSIRHPLMICDWGSPDTLPPPLVSQDILDTKKNTSRISTTFEDIFQL